MLKLNKFKLLGLVVVLAALLAGAGSWMALQALGKQNGVSVKALNCDDRVRFVIAAWDSQGQLIKSQMGKSASKWQKMALL